MKILILLFVCMSAMAQEIPGLNLIDEMKGKAMVALGESGHAVAGFHHARSVIATKLIQESNFRNIFFEGDVLVGFKISRALDSCRNPQYSMEEFKKSFLNFDQGTYRHQEFYAFYESLCQWNKRRPNDPVRIFGIDIWSNYWDISKALESRILPLKIAMLSDDLKAAKENCFLWSLENPADYANHPDWDYWNRYKRITPERHTRCLGALQSLKSNLPRFMGEIPPALFFEMYLLVDNGMVQQFVRDLHTFDFSKAMNIRDSFQARATLLYLDAFNVKSSSLFLAHNLHIFKKMSVLVPQPNGSASWTQVISAGENLKAFFGEAMATVAIGGFKITSLRDGPYPVPNSPRSMDLQLAQKHSMALVKANQFRGEWWVHLERDLNGIFVKPTEQFDYYFFVRESGPATAWKQKR